MGEIARLALSIGFFILAIFTLGAAAGWRWGARGVRHEPTWIFVLMQLTWLGGVVLMFVNGNGLFAAAAGVLWLIAFVIQLRARMTDHRATDTTSTLPTLPS